MNFIIAVVIHKEDQDATNKECNGALTSLVVKEFFDFFHDLVIWR